MVDVNHLQTLFSSLPLPTVGENTFSTGPVRGTKLFVGKDGANRPALLLPASESDPEVGPVELMHVLFLPKVFCKATDKSGGDRSGNFSVLRCTSTDFELHSYFLRVLSGVTEDIDMGADSQRMADVFQSVLEVFRSLTGISESTIQGLWCELLVIACARRPIDAALAWHSKPSGLYDFESGECQLEVKSTVGFPRQHQFRLEQVKPRRGSKLLVCSFVLVRNDLGPSLGDLWDEVSDLTQSSPAVRTRVFTIVTQTLEADWRRAQSVRFDRVDAWKNIELFFAEEIPQVSANLPRGVSEVRFTADLSGAEPISTKEARRQGQLFGAVF